MHRDPEPLRKNEILDLVALHRRQPDADPPRWSEALAAMAQDESVRAAALEEDPLLLFQELPETEVDAREVEEMKRSVRELRHARQVEADLEPKRQGIESRHVFRGPGRRSLGLAAALAVLLLGASLFLPSPESPDAASHARGSAPPQAVQHVQQAGAAIEEAPFDAASRLPLVEDLDGSEDLIQIESAEISVVVASLPTDFEI